MIEEIDYLRAKTFAVTQIKVLDVVNFVIFADRTDRSQPLDDSVADSITSPATQAGLILE